MNRKTQLKLKLQMGLSPDVTIDPPVLRAMWRQLCLERLHARRDLASRTASQFPAALNTLLPD